MTTNNLMKSLIYQTLLVLIMPLILIGCGKKSQPIEYEDIAGVKMALMATGAC